MSSFENFTVGQKLRIPEIDGESDFTIRGIYPGGMGLCLCIENDGTGDLYALKGIQRKLLSNKNACNRYARELRLWHVASSCDGVVEAKSVIVLNCVPYMVSEWVANGDLSIVVRKMKTIDKVKAFLEVVETLGFVYDAFHIIHRDLKPQNILIKANGRALVSDWGLSKIYGSAVTMKIATSGSNLTNARLTMLGSCLGTVLYMAPEQIRDSSNVDFRADIYSLGCILYELETGHPPFISSNVHDIMNSHLHVEPAKIGGFFKKSNLGLEKAIEKCLKKDPKERYQSYEELVNDVKRLLKIDSSFTYHHPARRYLRNVPGEGSDSIKDEINKVGKDGFAILSDEKAHAILEEANVLIATDCPREAVRVLMPFAYNLKFISSEDSWHIVCNVLSSLAYALSLSKKIEESINIYKVLEKVKGKSAEFYLNYSYANLLAENNQEVIRICNEGILIYPNDGGLYGNLADAYILLEDADNAIKAAKKAVEFGGITVQSCEEMNNALHLKADILRGVDWLEWGKVVRSRYDWINRGLKLNPNFQSLQVAMQRLIAEVDSGKGVLEADKLLKGGNVSLDAKQVLIGEWATGLRDYVRSKKDAESKKDALASLEKFVDNPNLTEKSREAVCDAYYFILLNFFCLFVRPRPPYFDMVTEYYLKGSFSRGSDGKYRCPIEVAQIFIADAKYDQAIELLKPLAELGDWYAQRIYVTALIEQKDYHNALNVACAGIKMKPQNCDVWDTMERAYRAAGMMNDADRAKRTADEMFDLQIKVKNSLLKVIEIEHDKT